MEKCRNEFFRELNNSRVECLVCPNKCVLTPGKRGRCGVFLAETDGLYNTVYGKVSGFCIDPIEKKPLNHFLPGSPTLSLGTIGCNLSCKFCQNWDISIAREREASMRSEPPQSVVDTARSQNCQSIACTYNEPTIFIDYCLDIADKAHETNLKMVAVTNGYIVGKARELFYDAFDAANVDLKGFTDEFYKKHCKGHLQPVLDTLEYIHNETDTWLEITTLLIPDENDSFDELGRMIDWILDHLGSDVPLHFSAFHPQYKMLDKHSTSAASVIAAREQALTAGLKYVYTGNIYYPEGEGTHCPSCNALVIGRNRYDIDVWNLRNGQCTGCNEPIAGIFKSSPGNWGSQRRAI